jgi:hypothetical protein
MLGEVKVAICARRRTVSRGKRTASSTPEPMKLNKFQEDGCSTGSRERYDLRINGVLAVIKFGRLEWRMVIGIRCGGIV